jgi:hypothetical protein
MGKLAVSWALALVVGLVSTTVAVAADPVPTPEASGTPTPVAGTGPEVDPAPSPAADPRSLPSFDLADAATGAHPLAASQPTTTAIILTYGAGTVGFQSDFHVQTNPMPPGGTVDLLVDGSLVDSATFPGDTTDLILHWAPTSPGDFTVTARYNGTAGYDGSISEGFAFSAALPTPYIDVESSNDAPALGETVHFTATLSPNPLEGTIEWSVDDVVIETVALQPGGTSAFATSFDLPYVHAVKAHFTGNDDYLPSTGGRNVYLGALATTMTITVPPDPIAAGPVTATVTLDPNPGGGTLTWRSDWAGYTTVPADADGTTEVDLGEVAPGSRWLEVAFNGHGQYGGTTETVPFSVLQKATITVAANRATAIQGELPVVLSATATPFIYAGTVTFLDDVAGSVVSLGPVAYSTDDGRAMLSTSALRVGVHSIRARFDGVTGIVAPATSAPITVSVAADTSVHATFTPSSSKFYPARDGYRDTVSLGGRLDERATVTIRIYNSAGTRKRTFSLGTRAIGSYAVSWNGKTASGSRVAAGKYTLKASFKDVKGHTRTIVGYTTVSWREVAWKTASTVTRYGDEFAYYATPGDHLFLSDDYSRGRVLYSNDINSYCDPDCDIVYGIKTFTLTSTALAYRSVQVTVVGHTYVDFNSGSAFFRNWSTKTQTWKGGLPEYATQPHAYTASAANISSDRKVQFGVWCTEDMGDAFDLHRVRLTYQYAVWK